jgi:Flp pilus assembly pilin Flp
MLTACRVSPACREAMTIRAIVHLVIDDSGQDLVEYALLTGMITVAGVLLFPVLVARMNLVYQTWQLAAQRAWEPCAPGAAPCF